MTFLCGAGGEGRERPWDVERRLDEPAAHGAGSTSTPAQRVPPDPRWALTLEIVDALHRTGTYAVDMDARPVQRLVDVQWAGHQAARLLGGRAAVVITAPDDSEKVTLVITYEDPDGTGFGRSQAGLEELLHSVRNEQSRTGGTSHSTRFPG